MFSHRCSLHDEALSRSRFIDHCSNSVLLRMRPPHVDWLAVSLADRDPSPGILVEQSSFEPPSLPARSPAYCCLLYRLGWEREQRKRVSKGSCNLNVFQAVIKTNPVLKYDAIISSPRCQMSHSTLIIFVEGKFFFL